MTTHNFLTTYAEYGVGSAPVIDEVIKNMVSTDIAVHLLRGPPISRASKIERIINSESYRPYDDINYMTVEQVAKTCCPEGWENLFADMMPTISSISTNVENRIKTGQLITPNKQNLFAAFYHMKPVDTKIIIIGQDPYLKTFQYPYRGQTYVFKKATGMAFSQHYFDYSRQPSLQNIFDAIRGARDDPNLVLENNDLTPWAKQGVLLLNSSLTGDLEKPGIHGKLWHGFVIKVLEHVLEMNPNVIIVMWGNEAQKLEKYVSRCKYIIKNIHPAARTNDFRIRAVNDFQLIDKLFNYHQWLPINWSLPALPIDI